MFVNNYWMSLDSPGYALLSMISFVEITLAYGTDNAAIKDACTSDAFMVLPLKIRSFVAHASSATIQLKPRSNAARVVASRIVGSCLQNCILPIRCSVAGSTPSNPINQVFPFDKTIRGRLTRCQRLRVRLPLPCYRYNKKTANRDSPI